jgi:predicted RNA-binding Zn ribbon-like protein
MTLAYDTEESLAVATALVNTRRRSVDTLATLEGLREFLDRFSFTGRIDLDEQELDAVRLMRERLRGLWFVRERDEAAIVVNEILADTASPPYLSKHDELDWHLHVTRAEAPLADRLGAEAAMGFLDLIRTDQWDRVGLCAGVDCTGVLVDLSKNRSKRYCDSGCGNRANVAAYRARKRVGGP